MMMKIDSREAKEEEEKKKNTMMKFHLLDIRIVYRQGPVKQ
jgi:hypothetical protein